MSRSLRKVPYIGHTLAESEKDGKRICNRIVRRVNRVLLRIRHGDFIDVTKNDAMSTWAMSKDGKQYWPSAPASKMRK